MSHVINAGSCTNCGVCAGECPVEAIKSNGSVHVIDAGSCIDCGACVSACPTSAISAG